MKFLTFLFLISIAFTSSAQLTYRTTAITIQKESTIILADVKDDWMPVLHNLDMPFPGGEADEEELKKAKEEADKLFENKKYHTPKSTRSIADDLVLYKSFEGKAASGAPNDNDAAISNDGILISVANTNMWIYNTTKNSELKTSSINGFDPKIYYDPVDDRFIMVYLTGSSTNNTIHVDFTATNDPMGAWNTYTIGGTPFNNGTWSDYPIIGASEKEFFLTVNMVQSGQTWQAGFRGSLIYQMDKQSAYAGVASMNIYRHDSIYFNNTLVRNICPVRGGSTTYGPNMYFLSNKNLSARNDTLFLLEVTDTIGSPDLELKVKLFKSPVDYFLAPSARGTNGSLQTNDSRVLGAFYENDNIQFVQNTRDTSTGFAAVLHGIIHNVKTNPTLITHVIGDSVRDFGYPNIAYSGYSSNDNSAIISFDHSSPKNHPGISAVRYDLFANYSNVLYIKDGSNSTSSFTQNRWGDYSGCQRKYNEPGKAWVAGYYGNGGAFSFSSGTWIAEVGSENNASVNSLAKKAASLSVFPNPSSDIFSITFDLPFEQKMIFSIYDVKGSLVKELLQTSCFKGKNLFSFSTAALFSGVYLLKIQGDKNFNQTEKIIKQ